MHTILQLLCCIHLSVCLLTRAAAPPPNWLSSHAPSTKIINLLEAMSVLLGVLLLTGVYPTLGDPGGDQCKEAGSLGCVCRSPKGLIDLTPIANLDGTPR